LPRKDVSGLTVARHLRGEIYEVRASGARTVLFASDGAKSQVLLAISAFTKKTQRTPPAEIRLAERRLADWRRRGHQAVADIWVLVRGVQGGTMARKDDLDQLIDELAEEDAALPLRVAAALERRELARQPAQRRRDAGLAHAELAARMGTSQSQITRFESGAETRLSTVARYAAAIGIKLRWSIDPLDHTTERSATTGHPLEPIMTHEVTHCEVLGRAWNPPSCGTPTPARRPRSTTPPTSSSWR
jgi:hypothetical protein